jgi:hypothetical protein
VPSERLALARQQRRRFLAAAVLAGMSPLWGGCSPYEPPAYSISYMPPVGGMFWPPLEPAEPPPAEVAMPPSAGIQWETLAPVAKAPLASSQPNNAAEPQRVVPPPPDAQTASGPPSPTCGYWRLGCGILWP